MRLGIGIPVGFRQIHCQPTAGIWHSNGRGAGLLEGPLPFVGLGPGLYAHQHPTRMCRHAANPDGLLGKRSIKSELGRPR